jgi:hypothetical protein
MGGKIIAIETSNILFIKKSLILSVAAVIGGSSISNFTKSFAVSGKI